MIIKWSALTACVAAALVFTHSRRTHQLPYYNSRDLTPEWLPVSGARTAHRIGEFALTDQRGHVLNRDSLLGRVTIASFFFTECRDLCPLLRSSLQSVQRAFAGDARVLIVSHTVRPEHDDTAVLARYARVNGLNDSSWRLVTGDRATIEQLARESYYVELADSTGNTQGKLLHTETLVLLDTGGHIRGVYDGSLKFDVERMVEDMGVLLTAYGSLPAAPSTAPRVPFAAGAN